MCGIAGFYGFQDDKLIKTISRQLAHRGPDGEGFFFDENVTLLNRRLAIIDLQGGDQPIYNEDQSVVTVYNGEIYNYRELKAELEKCGHRFTTKADTEVIVHGYEEWGETCFDRFNGMFAIALYDRKKKTLILARDHFGIKPLYYAFPDVPISTGSVEKRLVFSSEIKPIFHSGLIKKQPNDRIIYRYLRYRIHDDRKETFFDGIYKLMPGELMTIRDFKFAIRKFTTLQDDLIRLSQKPDTHLVGVSEVERFKKELIKAITYRLIADVPVGTCLSGGLDSSTVVSVVNKLLKEHIKESQSVGKVQNSFSAVFPNENNDEEKYIDELVKNLKLKVKNFKIRPTPESLFADLGDFIRTQEEPIISSGHYAQYKVMEEARKHVKVTLDGQGSDEMLAGYMPYYFVYLKQLIRERRAIGIIREMWGMKDVLIKYLIRTKKAIDPHLLLSAKFNQQYAGEKYRVTQDNLKKRLVEDIFYHSLPSLLRYEDRNAMRFSIEGRVPFLDFNLVRYIFSLPDEAIIKNGWNKFILRQSTKDLLPPLIGERRNKIGFTTPENAWFLRMKNRIYNLFLSESFANRKYFNQQAVLKAFQQFIEGKNDDTMLFWRILNLELWLEEFFDSKVHQVNKNNKSIKKKDINVDGKIYDRHPIKTVLFKKGDDIPKLISNYALQFNIKSEGCKGWFVVVSEKIVAIAQGRSRFIWDIKPSLWAKALSKYVTRTPAGIGLGSPWTMQLAIDEDGLPRILFASIVSFLTKPLGIKGLFYRLVSDSVASIDGPTEYSLYPSNVSAKLGPKNPGKVCADIDSRIKSKINPPDGGQKSKFLGVVIIDANDIGQKVLGNSTGLPDTLVEKIFKDNPMGQASEQTPVVIVTFK